MTDNNSPSEPIIQKYDRVIRIEGDALLPPSADPIFPEFTGPGEMVRVVPPVESDENDTRYWVMDDAYVMHPNDPTFGTNNLPKRYYGGVGDGLIDIPDPTIFRFKPKKRKETRHSSRFLAGWNSDGGKHPVAGLSARF